MKNYKNEKRDFYKILGVEKNVDSDTLKKVYRKLALKYHPDKNKNSDETLIKDINEAYNVLSDTNERKAYDISRNPTQKYHQSFESFVKNKRKSPWETYYDDWGGFEWGFKNPFNTKQPPPEPKIKYGTDLKIKLKIDVTDTHKETIKRVSYKRNRYCVSCSGTGFYSGKNSTNCDMCNGSGIASVFNGGDYYDAPCPKCKGTGNIGKSCEKCNSKGKVQEDILRDIIIPKYSTKGTKINFEEMGNESDTGGNFGKLIVEISDFESGQYKIDENLTLKKFVEIPFYDILLGTKITIQTPKNKIEIPISSKDNIYLIKNHGVPKFTGSENFSDIVIEVIPKYEISNNQEVLNHLKSIKEIIEGSNE